MLLTTLTEQVAAHLNSSPGKWTEDTTVEAKVELDPMLCVLSDLGVYVVPGLVQYNIEETGQRKVMLSISSVLFVSVIVSKMFEELPTSDGVAPWEECKPLVDLRQRVDEYVIAFQPEKLQLLSVESEPLNEIEMDKRNFVSITSFAYGQLGCVSQHELPSSLTVSRDGTGLQETTVSSRRQLLSGRRLGRNLG